MSTPALSASPSMTPATTPDETYSIVYTLDRHPHKKVVMIEDDAPLIDTTQILEKRSKRTKRLEKQQQKRHQKAAAKKRLESLLDLPSELLQEVFSHLRPSDIFRLSLVSRGTKAYIDSNEASISWDIIRRRYWVLARCFPLPVRLDRVDAASQSALRDHRRERMTEIHKKPYQHIKPMDTTQLCSCPSCLLAWNNLNVVMDFASFQSNLNQREPIPMIERGTQPQWNIDLTSLHAHIVSRAITHPLTHARILEIHLNSILGTLLRQTRFLSHVPKHRHNKAPLPKTVHPNRLYNVTEKDATAEDDRFLEREGRPSYEFPFHRDNYYSLLAYVPNRKWDAEGERWFYFAAGGHERDLEWIRRWFLPSQAGEGEKVAAMRAKMAEVKVEETNNTRVTVPE